MKARVVYETNDEDLLCILSCVEQNIEAKMMIIGMTDDMKVRAHIYTCCDRMKRIVNEIRNLTVGDAK